MADTSNLEFGRVLEGTTSDKKVWYIVIPAVLALGALLVFAGMALSKAGGLESKVRVAEQQAQEANKAVEERDKLLQKARADEAVLRSAGQGAAIMAAAQPDSPASGVALVHPEAKAVKLFAFGLKRPDAGQEYRAEALTPDKKRVALGAIIPDDRGTAFLLAKDLPEGATGIQVVLGAAQAKNDAKPAGDPNAKGDPSAKGDPNAKGDPKPGADAAAKPEGAEQNAAGPADDADATLVLAGEFPKPGTAGVVQAPDLAQQAQARTPKHVTRRPLR